MKYQFVDCRWELGKPERGRDLYLGGHIPGASFLDVDSDLSSPAGARGRHPLPDPEDFARAAGRAGIGDGVFVVAYGSMGGAERLWWLLRHFGHDACAVIELDGWHGPLTIGDEEIEPADFTLRPRDDDTIEAGELERRRGELVVVDARLAPRWRGEPNPIDKVPGRIPGALNARGTKRPRSYRRASSSLIAARGSRRPFSFTACTSPVTRASSTPAHGASGSSSACRSSEARRSTSRRCRNARGRAASRSGSSVRPGG